MPQHITLVVRRAIPDEPGTRRLVLQDPDGWPLPRGRPGAHLDIHLPGTGPRPYSMGGDTRQADTWEVAVKRSTVLYGRKAVHTGPAAGPKALRSQPQ